MPEEATLIRTEERSFPLSKAQAERLLASETLAVTLVGVRREAIFEVKPKRLAKLHAWLREQPSES